MKHLHNAQADVNIKVDLPLQGLESLLDKATNSAVIVIAALTVSSVVKSAFKR